jgi:hypothetical protein
MIDDVRTYVDGGFDRRHGTDTAGVIQLHELRIDSPNTAHGVLYASLPPATFRQVVNNLKIAHEEYVFVDFGSGKGRLLMLAAEYPFRRIIGVEFAPELHKIAMENIRIYKQQRNVEVDIASVCLDATKFPIPSGPCLLFFYSPFKGPVLSQVLDNIKKSVAADPRQVIIVFVYYGVSPGAIQLSQTMDWPAEELVLHPVFPRRQERRALILAYSG